MTFTSLEDRLKHTLGELIVNKFAAEAKIEELMAELKKLKDEKAQPSE